MFFLDAPGGTGKTFTINLLLSKIRLQGKIALAVASSGIAATLLQGGRTAHSALKLPLNIERQEVPMCSVSKGSGLAALLQRVAIIVFDECAMAHKGHLEALDRTMQDLRGCSSPIGGAVLLLAGDFRQTLPVIPRSTPADEIQACLKSSPLWEGVEKLTLSTNMRAYLAGEGVGSPFSNQLLALGEGRIPTDESGMVQPPPGLCNLVSSLEELESRVFPDLRHNYQDLRWISERAILSPKNEDAWRTNLHILAQLPGEPREYRSVDRTLDPEDAVNFSVEFLNAQEPPNLPPHSLLLKVGAPIILLRNLDPPKLCNGTRMVVKTLLPNLIDAEILTGCGAGERVFIPRIPLISSELIFEFKRIQFPVKLAFAMTINKSQGQTFKVAGINLGDTQAFAHGQLYVACSRVGNPRNLYVHAPDGRMKNVVYRQVLG